MPGSRPDQLVPRFLALLQLLFQLLGQSHRNSRRIKECERPRLFTELEGHRKAVFVVSVDQIEKAEALLEKNGFQTLDAEALSMIEPFHYMKY